SKGHSIHSLITQLHQIRSQPLRRLFSLCFDLKSCDGVLGPEIFDGLSTGLLLGTQVGTVDAQQSRLETGNNHSAGLIDRNLLSSTVNELITFAFYSSEGSFQRLNLILQCLMAGQAGFDSLSAVPGVAALVYGITQWCNPFTK